MEIRESLMSTMLPSPVPILKTCNRLRSGNCFLASMMRTSHGLLYPNPASMNSTWSRPSSIDLKKVVAAEVARATCQIVQSWKLVDESYVVKRVGPVLTFAFVIARTTLREVSTASYDATRLRDVPTYVFVHIASRNLRCSWGQVSTVGRP
jgi:hypothetical protein